MPLNRLLSQSQSFDPKAVSILVEAYEGVVAELGLSTPEERGKGGQTHCAQGQPDLDVAKLREGVTTILAEVRP